MKAVVQERYGPPDDVLEIRDVEEPTVRDDEVLLRVHAAPVAGDDWHLMRGLPYIARLSTGLFRPRNRVPGRDVAGRVEAVGGQVTGLKPGDEVFGWCEGAFAEYAAVSQDTLLQKPATLTFEQAAAVPVSGFTALQALRDEGRIQAGQKVLILGASGGVGTFAVQIAKAFGAEVTGACSTGNVALVRSLGADHVIDYTQEDFARGGLLYDLIVDLVGNRSLSDRRRALSPEGTLVLVAGTGGPVLMGMHRWLGAVVLSLLVRQRLRPLIHTDRREDLVALKELIDAGKLTPVVSAEYPLDEVREAIRHFEAGHARGKVVLTV